MPPKKWSSQLTRVVSTFDPHPGSLRSLDSNASEHLRCRLLALNKPCAFLHILIPDVGKVKHDHSYALNPSLFDVHKPISTAGNETLNNHIVYIARALDEETIAIFKDSLKVSDVMRKHIEEITRKQSSSMD